MSEVPGETVIVLRYEVNEPSSILDKGISVSLLRAFFFGKGMNSSPTPSGAQWAAGLGEGKKNSKSKTGAMDGNYTRMLRAVLNKSWRQHPTRLQLYGHLPPITKTIQVRRTRHAGHCWRSKDELISDVLLWTPTHGCASVGRPARTYIQQLCEDTGCNPEDLPEAMSDREKWRETVRDIRADGATWWWWWIPPYKTLLATKLQYHHIHSLQVDLTRHRRGKVRTGPGIKDVLQL